MNHIIWKFVVAIVISLLLLHGCSNQKATKVETVGYINFDTIQAGLFDTGKMWTFDFPPIKYFSETYGFTPTKEWFEKARLSTLRLPNCTASFISEDGLIMTNHHCAHSALDSANREGERLPEAGFYAATLGEERKVPGIYVDQLIAMEDVTTEVQQAFNTGATDNDKIAKRAEKIQEIQKRYVQQYKLTTPKDSMVFSVVSFYNGGRFSLYGYKRYTDVRLVYAPEAAIAFFGGDPDNFTYPRYDFDCAFFRVYENGTPLKTSNFFRLNPIDVKEGDVVFVIGNPGSTRRLYTVAQLEYLRDFEYPTRIEMYKKIGAIYTGYVEKHPDKKLKYLNTIYGLENSRKANSGYLNGLRDPVLMAKKRDFEKKFKESALENPDLKMKFGNPWKDIEEYQAELSSISPELDALKFRGKYFPKYLSLTADLIELADHSSDSIPNSVRLKFYPTDLVPEIEEQLLTFRLAIMKRTLGGKNDAFDRLLANRTPEQAAKELASSAIVASKEKTESLLSELRDSILRSTDPLIQFVIAVKERAGKLQKKYDEINKILQARVQILGNSLYEIYGTRIPPDATFTLRIADGVVKGYEYNGTIAPFTTTFYGLYDRYYSFGINEPWKLPQRWVNPPATFQMSTPMNFVSTNDVVGGNSGSPAINKDLQVVGLIFDGNIESLPGNIIFDETKNRSVSVHSAAILEGLEKIYNADRLAKELRAGKIVP
jgi:hypothetical protein